MTEIATLFGRSDASQHPFTTEDIFQAKGGLLRRRGKVVYATDFSDGYAGWNPVHNATGVEPPRSPLSLVDYPRSGMRIAAPGNSLGQGTATDAILRLSRPSDADSVVSFSFRYAIFTEYATGASGGSHQATSMESMGFGIDTQAWANDERQFFTALGKSTADVNSDTWQLRGSRASHSDAIKFVDVPAARGASGLLSGQNENKYNLAYGRITVKYGDVPEYIEMQLAGRTIDLRGITAVNEPRQWGATDYSANFRGGFNPFLSIKALVSATEALAVGLFVTDVCVTYGDELV